MRGKGTGRRIVLIGVALLGLGLYLYHVKAVELAQVRGEMAGRAAAVQLASEQPRFTRHRDALMSGPLTLAAGEVKRVPVVVRDWMANVKLTGRFSASGGPRNDVEVFVFASRDDFTNWESGNAANALYQSGRTTVANIEVPLKDLGTYDLVFSNRHAVILLRNIAADVRLEYDAPEK